jgi:hypothetical protein
MPGGTTCQTKPGTGTTGSLAILDCSCLYATDQEAGDHQDASDAHGNDRCKGPRYHKVGRMESPSMWELEFREDPEKHIVLFFGTIKARVADSARKEMLVFVPGYNVSFEDAARRTTQLAYDLQFDGVAAIFSWPSRTEVTVCTIDETNVAWSVPHLRAFSGASQARVRRQYIPSPIAWEIVR